MTSPSPSTPSTNVVTALDHRIEAAVGRSIEQLWQHRERHLLDDAQTRLADAHHGLVTAERAVTFYRLLLARLASGEFEVDEALCARIDRTVGQLAQAVGERDAQQATAQTVLEAVEKAARTQRPGPVQELSAPDFAALLAIAQGAKLREHLLTQRLSIVTASGSRVAYHQFQRFEAAPVSSCATTPIRCTPDSPSPSPTSAARSSLHRNHQARRSCHPRGGPEPGRRRPPLGAERLTGPPAQPRPCRRSESIDARNRP